MTTILTTALIVASKAALVAPKLVPWIRIGLRIIAQIEVI